MRKYRVHINFDTHYINAKNYKEAGAMVKGQLMTQYYAQNIFVDRVVIKQTTNKKEENK